MTGSSSGALSVYAVSFAGSINGSNASGSVTWNDDATPMTLTKS